MPSNLTETDQLKIKFNFLADELAHANTHLYKKLLSAREGKYLGEFNQSLDFWEYTITAHFEAAFLRLCRVYDAARKDERPERDPFHLLRFLEDVKPAAVQDADKEQHSDHMSFLRREKNHERPDPRVAKLRRWRNGVIAHRNKHLLLGGREEFLKNYPLDADEMQELIDIGFCILERWAHHYKSRCLVQRLIRAKDEYSFVLESLRLRLAKKTSGS